MVLCSTGSPAAADQGTGINASVVGRLADLITGTV